MPQLDFDIPKEDVTEPVLEPTAEVTPPMTDVPPLEATPAEPTDNPVNGLSQEELNDPNKINVTVADDNAPLLILFGPPACGKTMTLVRLTRFLQQNGYSVSPIRSFRPNYDANYKEMCEGFDAMINQSDAADSTNKISFMLVEVIKNGRRLCQILEAPGEYYFNPKKPNEPFPNYVNTIINSKNRKIWALMVEPDWLNEVDRRNYVSKIQKLKQKLRPRDKTIFVFNKIDITNYVISPGQINVGEARKQIKYLYPNIFESFRNQNPITRFMTEYLFDFVPFQTGDFTQASDGTLTFQEGPDDYPRKLWSVVLNRIRG